MEALLTAPEVASILRVGKWTIERWSREGFIPCAKVGKAYRYRQADIIDWFEAKKEAAR